MKGCKKLHLLQLLFLLTMFFPRSSVSGETPVSYCGGIRVKSPFLHQHPSNSSLLSHMIVCKSDKLYYRTSIGLFKISHIDYENKLLTVSHSSCSSASSFVSLIISQQDFLVHRDKEILELGTRISFDIPDHVPNPCDECEKPDGNCGVGLRCVCHPQKCKDKVISAGAVFRPCGNAVFCLVLIVVVLGAFH
ncbi:UNVERIFIED_CONTAM: hypothetical protein Sangu_0334300 [Sesamum angustifolium]|uniref:Uncharacterized protein n=1 Tax=Sesamum angustifolium TaxID=2727405 RepID=A0AAW2QR96_9LAMI